MDANGETAASREDAYLHEDTKQEASKSASMPESAEKLDVVKPGSESKTKRADTDDLLEKIEEVVKDNISENTGEDITKSSEQEFLKKIEEMENDTESDGENKEKQQGALNKVNDDKCEDTSEKVAQHEKLPITGGNSPKSVRDEQKSDVEVESSKNTEEDEINANEKTENCLQIPPEMNHCNKEVIHDLEKGNCMQEQAKESTSCISTSSKTDSVLLVKGDKEDDTTHPEKSISLVNDSKEDKSIISSEVLDLKKVHEKESTANINKETAVELLSSVQEETHAVNKEVSEKDEEPMLVDEPPCEPMDLDVEEKMDVDDQETHSDKDLEMKDLTNVTADVAEAKVEVNKENVETLSNKEDISKAETLIDEKLEVAHNNSGLSKDLAHTQDDASLLTAETNEQVQLSKVETKKSEVDSVVNAADSKDKEGSVDDALVKDTKSEKSESTALISKSEEQTTSSSKLSEDDSEIQIVEEVKDTEKEKSSLEKGKEEPFPSSSTEVLEEKTKEATKTIAEVKLPTAEEIENLDEEDSPIKEATEVDNIAKARDLSQGNECTLVREEHEKTASEKTVELSAQLIKKGNPDQLPPKKAAILKNLDKNDISLSDKGKKDLSASDVSESSTATNTINVDVHNTELPSCNKVENKPLINMKLSDSTRSLNSSPVAALSVFNSTPIQKQFEISSENVSKISEEPSHTEKIVSESYELNVKPTENLSKTEESSESGACASTEHEHQSSDEISKYINVIQKYNGITDGSTDDEKISNIKDSQCPGFALSLDALTTGSSALANSDSVYEVNVWYENNDLRFLSVERLEARKLSALILDKTSGESLEQGSSNGSVTSLPTFPLPGARPAEVISSGSLSLSSSQRTSEGKSNAGNIKKSKHIIKGISDLCNLMIDEFTKIKSSLNIEKQKVEPKEEPTTPKSRNKEMTKKNLNKKSDSPTTSVSPSPVKAEKRSRKRSLNKSNSDEDDDVAKPKAKQARKSYTKSHGTPSKETEGQSSDYSGQSVLAKWVDKKYYAGKITGEKPGHKFVVLFEDGASKVLPRESIVFGEDNLLPLKDQSVHALVDDDYECGTVVEIEKLENKVLYTVKAETKTVKITASDIYLQEDQAKAIQLLQTSQRKLDPAASQEDSLTSTRPTRNKRASASPVTPEAGFSGGIGKKSSKRQKRYS